ncbi:MAG: DMT family transporter [Bacilli bacterium]
MKSTYIGIVYAILSSVAYGVMPIIAKLAYAEGSNPTTVILFRFYIALVLLAGYILWKRMTFVLTWKQFGYLFTLGFFGYTITTLTLYLSYDFLGAGLATTLHFIYPGVVCLLGWWIFKERMDSAKWISLLLAAVGF